MVEKAERRWIWWFAGIVALLTIIPYLVGYARQDSGLVFTGFLIGVEDGNSYIAKMLSGANGDWLFRTPYTNYPQNGALIFFPYLLLGKLAAPPGMHEQLVALFHIFRIVSVFLLVFATYDFLAVFLTSPRYRRFGAALAILGGGLGWLNVIGLGSLWQNQLAVEFYSPEAFGFLMIFGLPHLACARACALWGLRAFFLFKGQLLNARKILCSLALWTVVGLMQPISIAVSWVIIAVYLLLAGLWQTWRQVTRQTGDWAAWVIHLRGAIWTGLLSAPLLVYTILVFALDPFLKLWERQNILTSPPFYHYLLSYGLIIPLAIVGIRNFLRRDPWRGLFILGGAVAWIVLSYLPFTIQRRLVEMAWVFLLILTMAWLENQNRITNKTVTVLLLTSFLAPLFLLAGSLSAAWTRAPMAFLPVEEVDVFKTLAEEAASTDVVLATYDLSNALPAWASVKTITGHGPESIDAWQIRDEVDDFFSSSNDSERWELIKKYRVNFVIWNHQNHLINLDREYPIFLELVYRANPYYLFRVAQPDTGDGSN